VTIPACRARISAIRSTSQYRGAQGLDPEFIAELEAQFGFDKPPLERFGLMMWNYAASISARAISATSTVIDLIIEKAAGFDLARRSGSAALLRHLDPAGHRQGGQGRLALRCLDERGRHRRLRDPRLPVRDPADRRVCRRIVLRLVPAARADLGQLGSPS
jgi:hypothetical protein